MKKFIIIVVIFAAKQGLADSWAKTFGETHDECAFSVQQTQDSGYIVAGYTNSFGVGDWDFLIIKIEPDGSMASDCPWHNCTPTVPNQSLGAVCTPSVNSYSLGADCTPTVTSPTLSTSDVCGGGVELVDFRSKYSLRLLPSPFRDRVEIRYEVPGFGWEATERVSLKIMDISGRTVRVVLDGMQLPGSYIVVWDGKDGDGVRVSYGVYFCCLRVDNRRFTCKIPYIP